MPSPDVDYSSHLDYLISHDKSSFKEKEADLKKFVNERDPAPILQAMRKLNKEQLAFKYKGLDEFLQRYEDLWEEAKDNGVDVPNTYIVRWNEIDKLITDKKVQEIKEMLDAAYAITGDEDEIIQKEKDLKKKEKNKKGWLESDQGDFARAHPGMFKGLQAIGFGAADMLGRAWSMVMDIPSTAYNLFQTWTYKIQHGAWSMGLKQLGVKEPEPPEKVKKAKEREKEAKEKRKSKK